MERRGFLQLLGAGVAGIALEQAIPLDRVWSFPKKIVVPGLSLAEMELRYLKPAICQLFNEIDDALYVKGPVGSWLNFRNLRLPQRTTITLDQVVGIDIEF